MKIKKQSAFYRATEFCSVMWDSFWHRSQRNPECVTRRLPLGTMDICTVGRVYLFTFLYFAYFAALVFVSVYFVVISPLEGLPDAAVGVAGVVKWLTLIFVIGALGVIGYFAVKFARKIQLPSLVVERAVVVKKAKKIKKPNQFWEAIKLRYAAFKARTCFFLEVDGETTEQETV